MNSSRPLSRDLLRETEDALKAVVGILDEVAPPLNGPGAPALDLHLALGLLDQIYALESASEPGDADGFRRALQAEYARSAGGEPHR